MIRSVPLLLAFAALLGACGGEEAEPGAVSDELVTYSRIGGFAYTEERLVVERDGSAALTFNEGSEEVETEFDLEPDELIRLEDRLEAVRGIAAPERSSVCADCFVYSVEADGVALEIDDAAFTADLAPEVSALILELGEIVRLVRERA